MNTDCGGRAVEIVGSLSLAPLARFAASGAGARPDHSHSRMSTAVPIRNVSDRVDGFA
jgi:hypothetical protein